MAERIMTGVLTTIFTLNVMGALLMINEMAPRIRQMWVEGKINYVQRIWITLHLILEGCIVGLSFMVLTEYRELTIAGIDFYLYLLAGYAYIFGAVNFWIFTFHRGLRQWTSLKNH
jgi:hypothetical protein